jgi:hypothetical protein
MDEAAFTALLARYPVVRTRNAVRVGRHAGRARASAAGAAGGAHSGGRGQAAGRLRDGEAADAATAAAASPSPEVVVPPKDFWQGLQTLLERHYGPEQARAVAARFDELHYASLRPSGAEGLNYEDVDELAGVMLAECEATLARTTREGGKAE